MWSPSVQDKAKVIVAYVQQGMLSPSGMPALCAINLIALDLDLCGWWRVKGGLEQLRLWNSSVKFIMKPAEKSIVKIFN